MTRIGIEARRWAVRTEKQIYLLTGIMLPHYRKHLEGHRKVMQALLDLEHGTLNLEGLSGQKRLDLIEAVCNEIINLNL